MTSNTQSKSLILVSVFTLALAGCALNTSEPAATQIAGGGISGRAYGGQQPVANATVTVRAAGTTGYGSAASILATTTADSGGNFYFAPSTYTCPQSNTPVYVVATGGNPGAGINNSLVLAAGLGACVTAKQTNLDLNEMSTVATAFAMAQFFTPVFGANSTDSFGGPSSSSGSTTTYSKGLAQANAVTIPTLVSLAAGAPNLPTATVTVDAAKLNTLANIIASCANSTGSTSSTESVTSCGALFAATTPPGSSTRPSDTLQAAVSIALYPYNNVSGLLDLSPAAGPFGAGLSSVNDWTVGIKYTTTAIALNPTAGTSSNLDIDANGNIWLPSTSPAGVAMFNPTSHSFNGPYTQAGLTHPQNLAINNAGTVYLSDTGSGLLTAFNADGSSAGSVNTLQTSQGAVAIGPQSQIWYTASGGLGGNKLTELQGGLLSGVQTNLLTGATSHYATSLAVTATNDVYSANSASGAEYMDEFAASLYVGPLHILPTDQILSSFGTAGAGQIARNGTGVFITAPITNTFCVASGCLASGKAGISAPQGAATDGANSVWIANSGNASVSTSLGVANNFAATSSVAYIHDATHGGVMTTPYGIGMDASGNVWISNATATGGPYVLSELVGAASPTITPLASQIVGGVSLVGSKPTN